MRKFNHVIYSLIVIGGGEIRTHETLSGLHAFQACSIGHSDTPPKIKRLIKATLLFNK
jgi:hypothetical protein